MKASSSLQIRVQTIRACVSELSKPARNDYRAVECGPVDYLSQSPYSPLGLKKDFPRWEWSDASEYLSALESASEIISPENRQEEKAAARQIGLERASSCIGRLNEFNQLMVED